jgi:hypothetical protein
MSEKGYVLRTRNEHVVACEAIQPQKDKAGARPKKRASSPASAKPTTAPDQTGPTAPARQ